MCSLLLILCFKFAHRGATNCQRYHVRAHTRIEAGTRAHPRGRSLTFRRPFFACWLWVRDLSYVFFFVCLFATPAACRSLTFALRSEEKFWNKTPFVNHSLLNVEFLIIFPIFLLFDLFSLLFLVSFGIFVSFFVFSVLFVKFTYASCGLLRVSVFFLSVLHDAAMIVSHYAQFSTFSFLPLVCVFSFYNNFYV